MRLEQCDSLTAHAAAMWARGCATRGVPFDDLYDWNNRNRLYCTELVHDSYLADDWTPLFENAPMNFLDADGNLPVYWEKLFARLGAPVPQGVPGTNPQEMRTSTLLEKADVDITGK